MSSLSKQISPEAIAARMNPQPSRAAANRQAASSVTPLGEMTISVTLDQLRAFDANPRTTRNPKFDEIKESIMMRGLDSPPQITKRPNEEHFIIRNGGNTRLQILNELWKETKDEKFFRIQCLFRPWESEVSTLVGHLAENELHGTLLFVEKALGIKSAKEMFEKEEGKKISQRELSKRLSESGFPVSFGQISKMLDCVENLLPAIPNILYAGLGKAQIESLLALRSGLQQVYLQHGPKGANEEDFKDFWIGTLSGFDFEPDKYRFNIVEDTMIGDMSRLINREYKMIELDLVLNRKGGKTEELAPSFDEEESESPALADYAATVPATPIPSQNEKKSGRETQEVNDEISAAPEVLGEEKLSSPTKKNLRSIDEAAIGKRVTSSTANSIESLRHEVYLAAAEIGAWAGCPDAVAPTREGLGYMLVLGKENRADKKHLSMFHILGALLRFTEAPNVPIEEMAKVHMGVFSQMLIGGWDIQIGPFEPRPTHSFERLSDDALMSFFRLVRSARLLVDLNLKRSKP